MRCLMLITAALADWVGTLSLYAVAYIYHWATWANPHL